MRRRVRSGFSLIELLAAALIFAVGLMGTISLWAFCYTLSVNNTDQGNAYSLGRLAMEHIRMQGFSGATEGTTTTYYSSVCASVTTSAASRYTETTSVVSDTLSGGEPTATALRTVTVTVNVTGSSLALYTTTSCLAKGGV